MEFHEGLVGCKELHEDLGGFNGISWGFSGI
jgi:hypothetical protein